MSAPLVKRFSGAERLLHWINAAGFLILLGSGLILYLPSLSLLVQRRVVVRAIHFWSGIGWITSLALVIALFDPGGFLRTFRELDRFDADDFRWLRGRRHVPQGRFNAGQKVNAAVTAAFTILFFASGLLMWVGERDTRYRFASTVVLHDGLMFAALTLFMGHLYLALIYPATRHALRGMTLGTVREDWASRRHAKWKPDQG